MLNNINTSEPFFLPQLVQLRRHKGCIKLFTSTSHLSWFSTNCLAPWRFVIVWGSNWTPHVDDPVTIIRVGCFDTYTQSRAPQHIIRIKRSYSYSKQEIERLYVAIRKARFGETKPHGLGLVIYKLAWFARWDPRNDHPALHRT